MTNEKIGEYAFILGVIIAVVAGLAAGVLDPSTAGYVTLALVILGLVVGILNVGDKNLTEFLIASIALIAVGTANLSAIPVIGSYLASMVLNIAAFVAPAALVVGLKVVYNLAAKP
ncbi:MAG: hypothetical protein ISS36_02920 [Candidatus Aenigmarchaeota archaeon]|nr:hypothetical protein [Candidatus Aenigmarchaeota archaeon]